MPCRGNADEALPHARTDASLVLPLSSAVPCRTGKVVAEPGRTPEALHPHSICRAWLGGDAQIADRVLERRCQRAIFFEDPHVARQHEADIQLLERAVTTVTDEAVCITAPNIAARWAAAVLRQQR